jgi:outer membrane lipoprotein-sorting protein
MTRQPERPDEIERMFANDTDSPPPELEARMQARLQTLRSRIESVSSSPVTPQENWIMSLIRNLNAGRVRWATVGGLAIAVLIVAFAFIGNGPASNSYAAVVERLKKAATARFNMEITGVPGMNDMEVVFYRKEPDKTRMEVKGGAGDGEMVSVVDTTAQKVISLIPATHKAVEFDLGLWRESDSANDYFKIMDRLDDLPAEADSATFDELDGRRVRVYLVHSDTDDKYLWIDDATGDLLRYVIEFSETNGGNRVVMSDFQFNLALDDALFSVEAPEGYELVAVPNDAGSLADANETHLLDYLRISRDATGAFPAIVDPARPFETSQLMAKTAQQYLQQEARAGRLKIANEQEGMKLAMQFVPSVFFVTKMNSANDYHYAGDKIAPGNPNDWIAWWRPDGSTTYRVILGDLSIIDASPEEAAAH